MKQTRTRPGGKREKTPKAGTRKRSYLTNISMRRFWYGLLFSLLLLDPFFLSAQLNESDTLTLKASLAVTGFWQGGNVQTFIFRARSDVSYKPWKQWVAKTQNSYVYQAFGGEKADEDILSLNFLYFNPQQRIYPQLLGFVSTNFRREINLRSLFGVGFTYQILKKEDHWLKVSLSSEYEQTDFARDTFNLASYNGTRSINTLRGTVWISGKYQLLKDKVILRHESYVQPSLQQSDNFRWQADLGLEFPVWKFLSFKVNYIHFFENIVIANQSQEDRFLTFGLTIKSF